MARSQTERTRLHHQRLRERGLHPLRIWLPKEDAEALKTLAVFHDTSVSRQVHHLIHTPSTLASMAEEARKDSIPTDKLY